MLWNDKEKAADFTQDLFLKVIEKVSSFNLDYCFKTWIFSIANNMCKNEYRKDHLSAEQIKLSRGDIVPPENYPYFLAECKNYAEFPFHLLLGKNSIAQLDTWIDQVEHDVTSEFDLWMLFIKITR